jgi:succinyl-diaminopimelate desuccinylase
MSDIQTILGELLAIPSIVGEETAIANYVEARLRARLADVRRHGNAIVGFAPPRGRPRVAFAGHLDTVAPAPDDPNPPRIVGDRQFGLGASDMKGAIACDLLVLDSLDLDASPFDLAWVYYDREEGPLAENGLRPLFDSVPELVKLDLAICGEPTDNKVQLGCVGSLHAKVAFTGRAAHSARPWQGENAIHKGGKFLAALAAVPVRDVTLDGLLFREVLSATLALGGRSRNVVPDRFEINVNARFSAATDPKQIEANIRALAAGGEVTIVDLAPAAHPRRDHPIIDRIVGIAGAPPEPKQAWTDVAQFAEHGVAALNFGPGEQAQAHQRGESVSLQSVDRGLELRRRLLARG